MRRQAESEGEAWTKERDMVGAEDGGEVGKGRGRAVGRGAMDCRSGRGSNMGKMDLVKQTRCTAWHC